MIKKNIEDELIVGMQKKLASLNIEESELSLDKAVDYINSAIDIFEDRGMQITADQLLSMLLKIAKTCKDRHAPKNTKQMVKNLLNHGTMFNMADDNFSEDLLDTDISDELEVEDSDISSVMSFEDEID